MPQRSAGRTSFFGDDRITRVGDARLSQLGALVSGPLAGPELPREGDHELVGPRRREVRRGPRVCASTAST